MTAAEAIMSSTRAVAIIATAHAQEHLWLELQPDGKLRWVNADAAPALGLGEYATVEQAATALAGLSQADAEEGELRAFPCRVEIWHYPARLGLQQASLSFDEVKVDPEVRCFWCGKCVTTLSAPYWDGDRAFCCRACWDGYTE